MIDIVFTFDTTGSMYPCLHEVRRSLEKTAIQLMKDLSDLRIGFIAHGDYCDKRSTYITKHFPLSDSVPDMVNFVKTVSATEGGDAAECYELVLYEAKTLNWREGAKKILVMLGDNIPHGPLEAQNYLSLRWEDQAKELVDKGISIYAVQCLYVSYATSFWNSLAQIGNGYKINLPAFSDIIELIKAVTYKQGEEVVFNQYIKDLQESPRLNRAVATMIETLTGKKSTFLSSLKSTEELKAVEPGRFQILSVDKDVAIKDFVILSGATFAKGKGFYEFTKPEIVQEKKEVVLVDKKTGDMFSGAKAREMIGIPYGIRDRVRPVSLANFTVFIQSTSYNRILKGGTRFLYEVSY